MITPLDKLFAHISNDSEIHGTQLEGNNVAASCSYLLGLEVDNTFNINVADIVAPLRTQLTLIQKTSEAQSLQECHSLIMGALENSNNKPVSFNSGWAQAESYTGHTIISQLQYDSNNNLDLIIYNSGAGIERHTQKNHWKGKLSATALIFKIPAEQLLYDNLSYLVNALIELCFKPANTFNNNTPENIFYSKILHTMHMLDAVEQEPELYNIFYSIGQRSGTCSWKSVMAFVKNNIKNERKYNLVKIKAKFCILNKYFFTKKSNNQLNSDPMVRSQIKLASENLIRLIKKDDIENKNHGYSMLDEGIRGQIIKSIWKFIRESDVDTMIAQQGTALNFHFEKYKIKTEKFTKEYERVSVANDSQKEISIVLDYPKFDFDNISESIDKIFCFSRNENVNEFTRLQILELIINTIKLPLDMHLFLNLYADQSEQLGRKLADLSHLHMYLCGRQCKSFLRYESYVAALTLHFLHVKVGLNFFTPALIARCNAKALFFLKDSMKAIFFDTDMLPSYIIESKELTSRLEYIEQEMFSIYTLFDKIDLNGDNDNKLSETYKDFFLQFSNNNLDSDRNIFTRKQAFSMCCELYRSSRIVIMIESGIISGESEDLYSIIDYGLGDQDAWDTENNDSEDNDSDSSSEKLPKKSQVTSSLDYRSYLDNKKLWSEQLEFDADNKQSTIISFYDVLVKLSEVYRISKSTDCDINSYENTYFQSSIFESNDQCIFGFNDKKFHAKIYENNLKFVFNNRSVSADGSFQEILFNNIAVFDICNSIDIVYAKELLMLYISEKSSISIICEIIKQYQDKLHFIGTQDVIYSKLFGYKSIDTQISQAPEGILELTQMFNSYVVNNISKYKNNYLDSAVIFVLKVLVILEQYLLMLDETIKQIDSISKSLIILAESRSYLMEMVRIDRNNISLQALYIRTINEITMHNIPDVIASHILFSSKYEVIGTRVRMLFLEQSVSFNLIIKNSEKIKSILSDSEVLKRTMHSALYAITNKENIISKIDGEYPFFICTLDDMEIYNINVLSGMVSQCNEIIASIPPRFSALSAYKHYFENQVFTGKLNSIANQFKFYDEKNHFYVIQAPTRGSVIQRDFWLPTMKDTRRYTLLSDSCSYHMQKFRHLPSTLTDKNHHVWIRDDSAIITDRNTKMEMYYVSKDDVATFDNKYSLIDLSKIIHNSFIKYLCRFEGAEFIEIWQSKEQPYTLNIKLPRYNIEFFTNGDDEEWIWSNDSRYKVARTPMIGLIGNFDSYIHLLPIDPASGLNSIIITPQQEFIYDLNTMNTKLDITRELSLRAYVNDSPYASTSTVDLEIVKFNLASNEHGVNYRSVEYYTAYEIDPITNTLQPRTSSELLHLAYILFSSHRASDSLLLLKQAKLIMTGTPNELKWLIKIITDDSSFIPLGTVEIKLYKKQKSSALSAVKAYVVYMLATVHGNLYTYIVDVEAKNSKNSKNKSTVTLYQRTMLHINSCVAEYYNKFNNISITMRLDKTQELLLLQEFNGHFERLEQLRLELEMPYDLKQKMEVIPCELNATPNDDLLLFDNGFDFLFSENYMINVITRRVFLSVPSATKFNSLVYDSLRYKIADYNNSFSIYNPRTSLSYLDVLVNCESIVDTLLSGQDLERLVLIENIRSLLKQLHSKPCYYTSNLLLKQTTIDFVTDFIVRIYYIAHYPNRITKDDVLKYKGTHKYNWDGIIRLTTDKYFAEKNNISKNNPMTLSLLVTNNKVRNSSVEFPHQTTPRLEYITPPNLINNMDTIDKAKSILFDKCGLSLFLVPSIVTKQTMSHVEHAGYYEVMQGEFISEVYVGAEKNVVTKMTYNLIAEQLTENMIENLINETISFDGDEILKKQILIILGFVNGFHDDPTDTIILELASRSSCKLNFKQILHLFLQQDMGQYRSQTFLQDVQIIELQQMIFDFLLKATKFAYLKKIHVLASDIKSMYEFDGLSAENRTNKILELAILLTATRQYDPTENLAMLLFEYLDDKNIRADQVVYLSELLKKDGNGNYPNMMCQMIMGSGKSKVLLPLLSKMKAVNDRLCVIVVSKDMYDTNIFDLTKTSHDIFLQKSYGMLFNRNTNIENNYFEKLYYKLLACIKEQSYIVTTPEAIQSLELKYLEILKFYPSDHFNWIHAEKVLKLIKDKADAIIDEVDQNLQTKKELNYAVGTKESITTKYPNLIRDSVMLFEFLENNCGIKDYILGMKALIDHEEKENFITLVMHNLCNDPCSVLHYILAENNPAIIINDLSTVKPYLCNKNVETPDILKKCSINTMNRLAVLRENLSGLLVQTLSKHRNESYGLRLTPEDSLRSNIAVPYVGANTPSTSSEFLSILEQINFTLQTHIARPIDQNIFVLVLNSFKVRYKATLEVIGNAYDLQNEFTALTGITEKIQNFILEDDGFAAHQYEIAKNNTSLRYYVLSTYILPEIYTHTIQEVSNAQDFIRQFSSVQGFTGTPYNYRTVEPFLKFRADLSHGVDGQTIDNIRRKTADIIYASADDLEALFSKIKYNAGLIRALIDQGAHCKYIPNNNVAERLRKIYKESNITYILYFNDDNILTALPTNKDLPVITLTSTDPVLVSRALNATPEQCFTFYDQRHATGVDIKQCSYAHALVTINDSTTLRDLLQSTMRMRGLVTKQMLQFVIPSQIAANIDSVDSIIRFTFNNQTSQVVDDHYSAAKQQIVAIVRRNVLQLLLDTTNDLKLIYMRKLQSFFFCENTESLFDLYGKTLNAVDSRESLLNFASCQIVKWKNAVTELSLYSKNMEMQLESQLTAICNQAAPVCKPIIFSSAVHAVGAEQQQEQKQLKLLEQHTDVTCERRTPINRISIFKNTLDQIFNFSSAMPSFFCSMQNYMFMFKKSSWRFSDNIYLSHNLYNSFKGQKDIFELKNEVYHVLIISDKMNQKSRYILLTIQDAEEIIKYCTNPKNNISCHVVIQSVHGFTHFNSNHYNLSRPYNHAAIMNEIAFYNGDSDIIVRDVSWLQKDDYEDKMKLLERIVACHKNKQHHFTVLKEFLSAKIKPITTKRLKLTY